MLRLSPRNFTPVSRTPWAGDQIANTLKLPGGHATFGQRIGESWEVSAGPEFPSPILGLNGRDDLPLTLQQAITMWPDWLTGGKACELLVKFVEAAEPLSFQVHPADGHPGLQSDECGKPESWLVLAAKPGAGIWIGFSRALSNDEVATRISSGTFHETDLQFVPVEPGDWFNIAPGLPHAIGPGVLIAEPQRVLMGRKGVTWRIWDWNRVWGGAPRPLQVEQALTVIDGKRQQGLAFAEAQRSKGRRVLLRPGVTRTDYSNPGLYSCTRLELAPLVKCSIDVRDGYAALLTIRGSCILSDTEFSVGEPGFIPARSGVGSLEAKSSGVELLLTTPASANVSVL